MTPSYAELSRNIRAVKKMSEKLDIKIILDCGSLLGAYREKGYPIKGDEDDIDFAVPIEAMQFKALDIVEDMKWRGFKLIRLRDTVMTFERFGSHIDLLFYNRKLEKGSNCPICHCEDYLDEIYYLTLYHKKEAYALKAKKETYDDLGEIEFMGTKLKCPKNIEEHLTYRYGDWKTPILRPAFSFQNYIDSGVMVKL